MKSTLIHNSFDTYKDQFVKAIEDTTPHRKYSKIKIKEKSIEWNRIGLEILNGISDRSVKIVIAYEFANYMIEKSLTLGNEYPYLHPQFENSFIDNTIETTHGLSRQS